MARDNQNRDLEALARESRLDAEAYRAASARASMAFAQAVAETPLPDWTMFEGVRVLRSGESRWVAVPRNGRDSVAKFDVIDVHAREHLCTLTRTEVRPWLWAAARADHNQASTKRTPTGPGGPGERRWQRRSESVGETR